MPYAILEAFDDINIAKSIEYFRYGDQNAAIHYATLAYEQNSGAKKLQAIANIVVFSADTAERFEQLIPLCEEGMRLASALQLPAIVAVLKAHKCGFRIHQSLQATAWVLIDIDFISAFRAGTLVGCQRSDLAGRAVATLRDAEQLFAAAQQGAKAGDNPMVAAHVLLALSSAYVLAHRMEEGYGGNGAEVKRVVVKLLAEARDIYQKYDNQIGVAYTFHHMATAHQFMGEPRLAHRYARVAAKLVEGLGEPALEDKIIRVMRTLNVET